MNVNLNALFKLDYGPKFKRGTGAPLPHIVCMLTVQQDKHNIFYAHK